ncbi:MAG TPA: hypothetical protein VK838_03660 [Candidatus Limnocylindrales bacterium]|nr:hypothetical protein [Candidatus Limnocylindrales bacterium]
MATGEVGGVAASTAASPGSDPGSGSVGRTEGAAPIAPALATAGILSLIVILGVAHDRRRRALTSDRRPDRMITPDHH